MSDAHDQLKAEVAGRLERSRALIAKKRELREELRLEIAELKDAIDMDERLDRALNPTPRNTAKDLYGQPEIEAQLVPVEPEVAAPAAKPFNLQ